MRTGTLKRLPANGGGGGSGVVNWFHDDGKISLDYMIDRANRESPPDKYHRPWHRGDVAPFHVGYYLRFFNDGIFLMYWNGAEWFAVGSEKPHWRQVGDYPPWRGLTKAGIKFLTKKGKK